MVCVLMWLVQEIFVLERLAGLKKQISYVGLNKNVSFYKFFKKVVRIYHDMVVNWQ